MNLDIQNLPPEVAAYIQSLEQKTQQLEQKNQQLEKQLVKMQSLNEQLVRMRKRMFGQSSEQIQYVDAQQLDFFNEAEVCSEGSVRADRGGADLRNMRQQDGAHWRKIRSLGIGDCAGSGLCGGLLFDQLQVRPL